MIMMYEKSKTAIIKIIWLRLISKSLITKKKRMSRVFSMKCKRCGTELETSIHLIDFRGELERLNRKASVKCPRCNLVVTYDPLSLSE